MVEASAFVVCLDDTEPADAEGRIRDMMMLDGFNRWVDKSIAFVVCKNASSGTYVEHTMIDVSGILDFRFLAISSCKPNNVCHRP